MTAPKIPDVARSLLKAAIMSLLNAGLIASDDAETLIALLDLGDA